MLVLGKGDWVSVPCLLLSSGMFTCRFVRAEKQGPDGILAWIMDTVLFPNSRAERFHSLTGQLFVRVLLVVVDSL